MRGCGGRAKAGKERIREDWEEIMFGRIWKEEMFEQSPCRLKEQRADGAWRHHGTACSREARSLVWRIEADDR